eukprot:TRINITY_DN20720_c0_g1_i1.p1 TRINITY_DN20720_c0_g1~~TRINITY_DN20720_c0_g1_i1.p1  ORF type:complete len:487 (+),score=54.14 TRINITY_DN20720_c0_g1_i1:312-1772(+)
MVFILEGRTLILPSQDRFVVVGVLLIIVYISVLWKIVPLLLACCTKMKKRSGSKVIRRRRSPKLAVASGTANKVATDPIEDEFRERTCMNSALPLDILCLILQNLHTKQHRREASEVCGTWYLMLAQLELQRRRSTRHCRRPVRTSMRTGAEYREGACKGKRLVETVIQPSGIPLAACLLRLCKRHTKGLIIKDARRMSVWDYKLIGVFGNNLLDLTIQNCFTLVSSTLVDLLDGCTSLRSLHLTVTSGLDDDAASEIARKCPQLQELRLSGCYGISPLGVMSLLLGCPQLETLCVKAMGQRAEEGSTQVSAPHVPEGPVWNVRVLGLTSSDLITDELLGAMAPRLRNLQQLDISNCKLVTDASVAMLIHECQGRLKDLKAKGSGVTDATLNKLARSGTEMRLLSLASCNGVTDNGIRAIANAEKMPALRHLCVSACRGVTDRGLEHLAKRQKNTSGLKILDVQRCPDISARGPKAKLGNRMVVIS